MIILLDIYSTRMMNSNIAWFRMKTRMFNLMESGPEHVALYDASTPWSRAGILLVGSRRIQQIHNLSSSFSFMSSTHEILIFPFAKEQSKMI